MIWSPGRDVTGSKRGRDTWISANNKIKEDIEMKNKKGIALFILLLLAAVSMKLTFPSWVAAGIACLIVAVLLSRRSRSRNTMTGAWKARSPDSAYRLPIRLVPGQRGSSG